MRPDLRIVNLETAVTISEDAQPDKGIHYRMHPANVPCLTAAGLHCCLLANNHGLDWGPGGLTETLDVLHRAGIVSAGAGRDAAEAAAPVVLEAPGKGRVLPFNYGRQSGGVPPHWAARAGRPGVNFLTDLSARSLETVAQRVQAARRSGDVVVASLHWGGNWGYAVPREQQAFARSLIDHAGTDVVHGHSSHHVKGLEVYRDRLILYGCGDFLNDYEGISGYEEYRVDLALMYFPTLDASSGHLLRLTLIPTQTRRFQVNRAPEEGVRWLVRTLNREGKPSGAGVQRQPDGSLMLVWRGWRGLTGTGRLGDGARRKPGDGHAPDHVGHESRPAGCSRMEAFISSRPAPASRIACSISLFRLQPQKGVRFGRFIRSCRRRCSGPRVSGMPAHEAHRDGDAGAKVSAVRTTPVEGSRVVTELAAAG